MALGCLALALLPQSTAAWLAYDRAAIQSGELWRLWTAHVVHFSPVHALGDAIVLAAMGALAEPVLGWRRVLAWLCLAAPLISLGLLVCAPAMTEYRGASGIAAGMAVAAAAALWSRSPRWKVTVALMASAFTIKTLCDALAIPLGSTVLPDGVAVAWQAHVLGAASGIALLAACQPVRDSAA